MHPPLETTMNDTGRIRYLCGPPGCGKSARLRERFVEAVRSGGADSVIWLAPDGQAAAALRDRIVSEIGGLYDPRILTFPALAHAVLNANHEAVTQLEPCQRTLLAGQLAARREMGFSPKLASRPGFIGALCAFVDELKRAAVHQDEFAAAVRRQFPKDERAASLARFYSSYQALLQKKKLFDEPGLFWQAHDLLEKGRRQPFEEAKLILVDGFTDFTTTQLQVLGHLAAEAEETIITLPLARDDREELWAAPTRLLERLQAEVGQGEVEWLESRAERPQPLRHLMDNLFCLEIPRSTESGGVASCATGPADFSVVESAGP
ncbi:MAG: UvrD-helicase domain-containing protein, partial [Armatimonadota bacterium]